jgi:hypothetical protein
MSDILKLGDKVMWRGAWGKDPAEETIIEGIQICPAGEKYGRDVKSVSWSTIKKDRVVVELTNGHWAYGHQLDQIS